MIAQLPVNVELDDLIQVGVIGPRDAPSRFDAARALQFESFATQRIRGAMALSLTDHQELADTARSPRAECRRAMLPVDTRP